MGRIPGFNKAIFPDASKPLLSLVANLGLVLFLFLVGLEVDIRMLLANLKVAVSVGAAGMMLPFGLGMLDTVTLVLADEPGYILILCSHRCCHCLWSLLRVQGRPRYKQRWLRSICSFHWCCDGHHCELPYMFITLTHYIHASGLGFPRACSYPY